MAKPGWVSPALDGGFVAEPLVLLRGLMKRRTQGDSVFELQVPELEIPHGRLVAVVGPSGCGKSTLLDLLALVMAPTAVAQFRVKPDPESPGVDIAALWSAQAEARLAALRRDFFGYVLQTGGLLPFLTVQQNIELPSRVKGLAVSTADIAAVVTGMGLDGCLSRYPDALSIGQRQRVAILRALLHQPSLVLADEPTAAVDKPRALQIMDDLRRLAQERGVAVVLVTHDLDLISKTDDIIYGFTMTAVAAQEILSTCERQR